LNSELVEDTKLSILNKENEDMKSNGYIDLNVLFDNNLTNSFSCFYFSIVHSILPFVNGNSSIERQFDDATLKGKY